MSFADMMMTNWMKSHTQEEKVDAMRKMMPKLLEAMSGEEMMALMSKVMPEIMKQCWTCMGKENMKKSVRAVMPKMMEQCFNPLNSAEKEEMFSFCKDMLSSMEEKQKVAVGVPVSRP